MSQVSPVSTTPLPQQGTIGVFVHLDVQVAALPDRVDVVHLLGAVQLVGQVLGGSQVSPVSTMPLPQQGTIGVFTHLAVQAEPVSAEVLQMGGVQLVGHAPV